MTEVVSIKFKNRGKPYSFDPSGLRIRVGDSVIVDTANGMEIAVCSRENHMVEDTAVVQPLRRVLRIATQMDLRTEELNRQREKTAAELCRTKIQEHELDMKLVDVECNFEGNKTTFFFTSDGRVDFRALVKDLASVLHNRIELRQIGVRDEAKMLGGLGICGRPYCCSQFLDDFHPVSTKMAKIQSLSLNPAKISGSCGRLMCCLRYEQEAYEDLIKKVPKQGAFVETIDGYGTAAQVNLLRQTVKVKLDQDKDDTLHLYKSNELAAVPGGRPRDGEEPPHVLQYVPEEPEPPEEPENEWSLPVVPEPQPEPRSETPPEENKNSRRRRSGRGKEKGEQSAQVREKKPGAEPASAESGEKKPQEGRRNGRRRSHVKVKTEPKSGDLPQKEKKPRKEQSAGETARPAGEQPKEKTGKKEEQRRGGNRRRRPRSKDRPEG